MSEQDIKYNIILNQRVSSFFQWKQAKVNIGLDDGLISTYVLDDDLNNIQITLSCLIDNVKDLNSYIYNSQEYLDYAENQTSQSQGGGGGSSSNSDYLTQSDITVRTDELNVGGINDHTFDKNTDILAQINHTHNYLYPRLDHLSADSHQMLCGNFYNLATVNTLNESVSAHNLDPTAHPNGFDHNIKIEKPSEPAIILKQTYSAYNDDLFNNSCGAIQFRDMNDDITFAIDHDYGIQNGKYRSKLQFSPGTIFPQISMLTLEAEYDSTTNQNYTHISAKDGYIPRYEYDLTTKQYVDPISSNLEEHKLLGDHRVIDLTPLSGNNHGGYIDFNYSENGFKPPQNRDYYTTRLAQNYPGVLTQQTAVNVLNSNDGRKLAVIPQYKLLGLGEARYIINNAGIDFVNFNYDKQIYQDLNWTYDVNPVWTEIKKNPSLTIGSILFQDKYVKKISDISVSLNKSYPSNFKIIKLNNKIYFSNQYEYVLTKDTHFVSDKQYYEKDENTYNPVDVTAGEQVTSNRYYEQIQKTNTYFNICGNDDVISGQYIETNGDIYIERNIPGISFKQTQTLWTDISGNTDAGTIAFKDKDGKGTFAIHHDFIRTNEDTYTSKLLFTPLGWYVDENSNGSHTTMNNVLSIEGTTSGTTFIPHLYTHLNYEPIYNQELVTKRYVDERIQYTQSLYYHANEISTLIGKFELLNDKLSTNIIYLSESNQPHIFNGVNGQTFTAYNKMSNGYMHQYGFISIDENYSVKPISQYKFYLTNDNFYSGNKNYYKKNTDDTFIWIQLMYSEDDSQPLTSFNDLYTDALGNNKAIEGTIDFDSTYYQEHYILMADAGGSIPSNQIYEFDNNDKEFILTTDDTFNSNKTYYTFDKNNLCSCYVSNNNIPREPKIYEPNKKLTEDTQVKENKKYYTKDTTSENRYVLANLRIGDSIQQPNNTYYEICKGYMETQDTTKKDNYYFTRVLTPTCFNKIGTQINNDQIYEFITKSGVNYNFPIKFSLQPSIVISEFQDSSGINNKLHLIRNTIYGFTVAPEKEGHVNFFWHAFGLWA